MEYVVGGKVDKTLLAISLFDLFNKDFVLGATGACELACYAIFGEKSGRQNGYQTTVCQLDVYFCR